MLIPCYATCIPSQEESDSGTGVRKRRHKVLSSDEEVEDTSWVWTYFSAIKPLKIPHLIGVLFLHLIFMYRNQVQRKPECTVWVRPGSPRLAGPNPGSPLRVKKKYRILP